MSTDLTTAGYYSDLAIRARMLEACGAVGGAGATAAFVAGLGEGGPPHQTWSDAAHVPVDRLTELWTRGVDISRSLWDTSQLVFMIELDYLNVDQPAEPFLRPAEVFFKLEPVLRAARQVFRGLSLAPRTLMTGRGYQFAAAVPLDHPVVDELAALARVPSWFAGVERRRPDGVTAPMTVRQAQAAEGLGKLIEFIAHRVLILASQQSPVPVVFNGTVVGSGLLGRECVSIDFSHVGDPLDIRHIRLPFSTYQWHRLRPDIFGPHAAGLPPLVALPGRRESVFTRLAAGRGLVAGLRAAPAASCVLPDVSAGISAALARYRRSALERFHREFDQERDAGATIPAMPLKDLPPCVSDMFAAPNDRLLKPEHLQHAVRVLMARGVEPAVIAGWVQTAYETDHHWGERWSWLDARARADFDVRVFAGLIATGLDSLIDLNCVSAQEKDICPRAGCRYDLRMDRDRLQHRASA